MRRMATADGTMEYRGDEELTRLLREARSPYDAAGVRELVRGVLAAPRPLVDPLAWTALVAREVSPVLRGELAALAERLAAEQKAPATTAAERLAALRAELASRGVQGF